MSVNDIPLRKRIALSLHAQQKKLLAQMHHLNYLMWECTLRCNLSCRHCGSDCRKSSQLRDMPLEHFLRVLDSITPHVDTHKTMLVLTGGEPLMRQDLEECGREFNRREFPWGMVSNGLALTQSRLVKLINSGLHSVTISLDGMEAEHNRMRGHRDSFSRAVNAIRMIAERSDILAYDVVTCVTQSTFGQLEHIRELLTGMGVAKWRIFTVFPIGRASVDRQLQLTPVQFRNLFEFIKNTRQQGKIHLSYGCEGFLGSYEEQVRDGLFFCRAGIGIGSVLADGSISACPNLRGNFVQGNIYEDDFWDVWNNRYQPYRDRKWARTGECARCKWFKHCQGNGMHLRGEDGSLLFCHLNRIIEGERQLEAEGLL